VSAGLADVLLAINSDAPRDMWRQGVVTAITGTTVTVQIGTAATPVASLPYLSSYTPTVGDVVHLLPYGSTFLVVGTVAQGGTIYLGPNGMIRVTATDVAINDNGIYRSVPRGRLNRVRAISGGSGVTSEVIIASFLQNLISGRRYRLFGSLGRAWGSAVNGQAIMRLRYAPGSSVTSSSTQIGADLDIFGFTTQALTALGGSYMDEFVSPSTGQFAVGLSLLQGNTNASISWNNAILTIDDIGT
jgi:hypothetical protein